MARFERFFERVLVPETGGAPDGAPHHDLADPGGSTQWGISARANPVYADQIQAGTLSKAAARGIYHQKYYAPIVGVDRMPERYAYLLFGTRVHGTHGRIVAAIQQWLNAKGASLNVDGVWGPNTYGAFLLLLPSERDELWQYLTAKTDEIASRAAKSTMSYQRRHQLPVVDYTKGFSNRLRYAMGDRSVWNA